MEPTKSPNEPGGCRHWFVLKRPSRANNKPCSQCKAILGDGYWKQCSRCDTPFCSKCAYQIMRAQDTSSDQSSAPSSSIPQSSRSTQDDSPVISTDQSIASSSNKLPAKGPTKDNFPADICCATKTGNHIFGQLRMADSTGSGDIDGECEQYECSGGPMLHSPLQSCRKCGLQVCTPCMRGLVTEEKPPPKFKMPSSSRPRSPETDRPFVLCDSYIGAHDFGKGNTLESGECKRYERLGVPLTRSPLGLQRCRNCDLHLCTPCMRVMLNLAKTAGKVLLYGASSSSMPQSTETGLHLGKDFKGVHTSGSPKPSEILPQSTASDAETKDSEPAEVLDTLASHTPFGTFGAQQTTYSVNMFKLSAADPVFEATPLSGSSEPLSTKIGLKATEAPKSAGMPATATSEPSLSGFDPRWKTKCEVCDNTPPTFNMQECRECKLAVCEPYEASLRISPRPQENCKHAFFDRYNPVKSYAIATLEKRREKTLDQPKADVHADCHHGFFTKHWSVDEPLGTCAHCGEVPSRIGIACHFCCLGLCWECYWFGDYHKKRSGGALEELLASMRLTEAAGQDVELGQE